MTDLYDWKDVASKWDAVGSRVVCDPAPTNTDEDFLVLDLDKSVSDWLSENGWQYGGSLHSEDTFASFKKGDVNVICAWTEKEYNSFMLATNVCRELNLTMKHHRIIVHDAIMYGFDGTRYNTSCQPF